MNVASRGNVNGKGAEYNVESESGPGKYYQVIHNSEQAKNFGVDYSCNCPAWINNLNDRNCKHIIAVEDYKNGIISKVTSKYSKVPRSPMNKPRGKGRPHSWEVKWCKYCKKSSMLLKKEGYCKYCGKKDEDFEETETKSEPRKRPIDDDTVSLGKDDMKQAMEKLGF